MTADKPHLNFNFKIKGVCFLALYTYVNLLLYAIVSKSITHKYNIQRDVV